jgi:hypothetical protein
MEKVVTKVRVGGSATPREDFMAGRRRRERSTVERKLTCIAVQETVSILPSVEAERGENRVHILVSYPAGDSFPLNESIPAANSTPSKLYNPFAFSVNCLPLS